MYFVNHHVKRMTYIAFWETSVANRLSGRSDRAGFRQRKTGWAVRLETIDAATWKAEVALVAAAHERLVAAVAGFDPARLDRPAGKRTVRPAVEYIHGVAEHTLYHTAQLKLIARLARARGVADDDGRSSSRSTSRR